MRHRTTACLTLAVASLLGACAGRADDQGWTYPDVDVAADTTTIAAMGASVESPVAPAASAASPSPSASPIAQALTAAPATASVRIADFAFGPATVTIAPGGRVEWTNADGDRHSILLDGTESERLETGGTHSREFAAAGRYDYVCGLHPSMTGTVIVAAAGDGGTGGSAAGEGTAAGPTPSPTASPTPDATARPTAAPTAEPTANPSPTSSPDDDDDDDDRDDDDRDDEDRSGHGGGDGDRDDEDHSGPGGGGSGHG